MIRMRGERERRRRESGEGIGKNGERLTALQAIGEVARGKLCEAGESVGNAFDGAKPRGTRTDGGEKRWSMAVAVSWLQSLNRLVRPTPRTVRLSQDCLDAEFCMFGMLRSSAYFLAGR